MSGQRASFGLRALSLAAGLALAAGPVAAQTGATPCYFNPATGLVKRHDDAPPRGLPMQPVPVGSAFTAASWIDGAGRGYALLHLCRGAGYMIAVAPVDTAEVMLDAFDWLLRNRQGGSMREVGEILTESHRARVVLGEDEIGRCDCDLLGIG
ncbi:hypothetical protein ACXN5S_08980 [Pseudoroseicyclus sp. H15]